MKKSFIAIYACVLCNIIGCGCFGMSECGNDVEKVPAYANASGQTVKIVVFLENNLYNTSEKYIADGDTFLSYKDASRNYGDNMPWYIPNQNDCGLVDDCDNPNKMELHFLDEPEKCLIFDGPIKDDGVDMRSWKSYKKGDFIENYADFWGGVEYIYTITLEHRNMAREEYCQ